VIRLAVRVRRAQAEIVLADLLELAPGGVEEVELDGVIEYAVYGSPGELPEVPNLRAAAGDALVEVSSSEVADDWDERWKRFHRPVLVESPAPGRVPALYVRPPWEAPWSSQGRRGDVEEIVIDPGQAFGTGGHATTRLCLELLLELVASRSGGGEVIGGTRLLDVGTGSGVLAIAAARLGYRPVLALDYDRASVTGAIENAQRNGVAIEVREFDLRHEPLLGVVRPEMQCESSSPEVAGEQDGFLLILANLVRPLLLDLAGAIDGSPQNLIASGLLCGEVDEVAGAFAHRLGLREQERRESGEWAAVWLTADPVATFAL
jgi:ribosomal protein L11 methyltransferase